jgi:hypothetical protein
MIFERLWGHGRAARLVAPSVAFGICMYYFSQLLEFAN